MRVSRLYIDAPLQTGQTTELDADAAHYARDVLRLKAGQTLILFNGHGGEYHSRLQEVSRKRVSADILQHTERDVESPLAVHLGLGISRGDRMDWALQKAAELGVAAITPLITERCVIKFDADKKQQRLEHWRGILRHAAEQCGRARLTALHEVTPLDGWTPPAADLKLLLHPDAEHGLGSLPAQPRNVVLLSGPEGGFSERERQLAQSLNFTPVRLGPRILRTETAVLGALSAMQTLWGDFR